jgi:hypothetical protein
LIEDVKMLTLEENETLWRNVLKEVPSDPMLRDLYFVWELMTAIRKRAEKVMSCRKIGLIARKEFAEWLKAYPELADKQ